MKRFLKQIIIIVLCIVMIFGNSELYSFAATVSYEDEESAAGENVAIEEDEADNGDENEIECETDETDDSEVELTESSEEISEEIVCDEQAMNGSTYSLKYTVENNAATITGFSGIANGDLVIPETIDGYKVEKIGYRAFYLCSDFKGNLVLPNGLKEIGAGAFCENDFSGDLIIPDSVERISSYAFRGCTSLNGQLILSKKLQYVDEHAFEFCFFTGDLIIPENVKRIMSNAFENCSHFDGKLYLPDSITSIDSYAFSGCKNLSGDLLLPDNLSYIGENAFSGCEKLSGEVVIPHKIEGIRRNTFKNCGGLDRIYIPSGVSYIATDLGPFTGVNDDFEIFCEAEKAGNRWGSKWNSNGRKTLTVHYGYSVEDFKFKWDSVENDVTELVIPDGVTFIPEGALKDRTALVSVYVPDSVKVIGKNAFAGCVNLKTIFISQNVSAINASSPAESPFYNCSSDMHIYCGGENKVLGWDEYWNYCSENDVLEVHYNSIRGDYSSWIEKPLLGNEKIVKLQEGTTYIPDNAFLDNKDITVLVIPATVKSIGSGVLSGCTSLSKVINNSDVSIELPDGAWFNLGDEELNAINAVSNGIAISGNYQITVHFDTDEKAELLDKVVTYGQAYGELPSPVWKGGQFKGWFIDKKCITPVDAKKKLFLDEDITLYAKWFVFCGDELGYEIDFDDNSAVLEISGSGDMYDYENAPWSGIQLDRIIFPDGITGIGNNAFKGQRELSEIALPEAITKIGSGAFNGCQKLKELYVGCNVTSIGNGAFKYTGVTLRGRINSYVAKYAFLNDIDFYYVIDGGEIVEKPQLSSLEHVEVTLFPVNGAEYKVDDGEWSKNNVFSNLEPLTEYRFYQRIAKTKYYDETAASEGLVVKTGKNGAYAKAPEPKINVITSNSVSLFEYAGCEISIDNEIWISGNEFSGLVPDTEYTVYQRYAENDQYDAGEYVSSISFRTEKESIIISLNANGGVFDNGEATLKIRSNKGESAKLISPGRPDYSFKGWIEENGTPFTEDTIVTEDISLFAVWESGVQVDKPCLNYESGSILSDTNKLIFSCGLVGADIFYTLDGTVPTRESIKYTGPFMLSERHGEIEIRAIAVKDGYADSAVNTYNYNVELTKDKSDYGDVIEADIEQYKAALEKSDEFFWVAGIENTQYTGKNITFDIRVYSYNKLLKEGKDYTCRYLNNRLVAYEDDAKAPTVIVTGKGNYSGKIVETFTIYPVYITKDSSISVDDMCYKYNGKRQFGKPNVYYRGEKLVLGRDYTLEYESFDSTDKNTDSDDFLMYRGSAKEEMIFPVWIKGKGGFSGILDEIEIITPSDLISSATVSGVKPYYCTGKEIIQKDLVVMYKGNVYTDYEVSYRNNINPGTAQMIIKGKGQLEGSKTISFKILQNPMKDARVDVVNVPEEVDGKLFVPDVKVNYPKEGNVQLVEDKDYLVKFTQNSVKGLMTITVTGIGRFTGSVKKTFKLPKYDISKDEKALLDVSYESKYCYMQGGVCPVPVVTFNGARLQQGQDYTLKYRNNNKVSDAVLVKYKPTIIVTGIGSFSGSREYKFDIYTKDIGALKVELRDKVYSNRPAVFMNTPVITDENGKALKIGRDYSRTFEYVYDYIPEDQKVLQRIGTRETVVPRKRGDVVQSKDIIPVGTVIKVKIEGCGSYTGMVYGYYRFAQGDISRAICKIDNQYYTGGKVEPNPSDITVTLGKERLTENDYVITGYKNNINKGIAQLIIRGTGAYSGTKVISYRIVERYLGYTVHFDKNNNYATGIMGVRHLSYGDKLPVNKFVEPGYKVVYWSDKEDGSGKRFKLNDYFKYTVISRNGDLVWGTDVTLYAIWEPVNPW